MSDDFDPSYFDDLDDPEEEDELLKSVELASALGLPADAAPKPKGEKPRFYCAGAKRTNPLTEKKLCEFKAHRAWAGACPSCGHYFGCLPWKKGSSAGTARVTLGAAVMGAAKPPEYFSTGVPEFDRVIGGGFVLEKMLMLGAPRGAGKTTLLLQAADGFARDGRRAFFASGEMTRDSVIDYARRLKITNENIELYGNPEGIDVGQLCRDVMETKCKLVLIDSLQVCVVGDVKGDIGQPTMMDAAVNILSSFAQKKKRSIVIISHLNKAGDYAGSEKAQHLVDGLVRFDPRRVYGPDGKVLKETDGLREIYIDGKLRQGPANVTSLVELTDEGIRPPSVKALRAYSNIQVVGS